MSARFDKVAILGAGTMGHALALVHTLGGCSVRLQDKDPEVLERAEELIAGAVRTLVRAGVCSERAAHEATSRIVRTPDLEDAVADADLVVEAVFEDIEVKREVFTRVDEAAPPDAIIASNTSYLDVFPLVPAGRARRTMIVHWYTPPYIIDLVDVVPGPETEPELILDMRDFLTGLGKRPIVLQKFIAGFIANRLQSALSLEIYALLDEGIATAEDIDASIKHGLAARLALLGQLMKADYAGLGLVRQSLANRAYRPPEVRGHCRTVDELVAAGRTGVMAGAGFYDYRGRTPAGLFEARDRKLLALKQAIGEIEREETVLEQPEGR
ncbi:MAG: 3-hydroxyacyl-CoA dehydrogenase family protein [Geminicoccaceae bacterium]|nr:3-hydroxyacyl-CoA dehydrogenase family protein [Geminicoccaceae bacterium]